MRGSSCVAQVRRVNANQGFAAGGCRLAHMQIQSYRRLASVADLVVADQVPPSSPWATSPLETFRPSALMYKV